MTTGVTGDSYVTHMVTAGAIDGQEPTQAAHTPLIATAPLSVPHCYPIPEWRPRNGRDKHCEPFLEAVTGLFHAFGLTLDQLYESPPTITTIAEPVLASSCGAA